MKQLKKIGLGLGLIISLLSSNSFADLTIQNNPIVTTNNVVNNATTNASIPSDESVQKLMQVLHINEMVDAVLTQQQQMSNAVKNLPTNIPATQDKKTSIFSRQVERQLQQLLTKYSSVFSQQIDVPKQRQAMLNAYQNIAKQHYNQTEVTALINFYDNPLGQQILQKQNQVSSEFIQAVMPMMAGDPQKLQQAFPSLQQDVEKIFN